MLTGNLKKVVFLVEQWNYNKKKELVDLIYKSHNLINKK